jgi:dihydrofolate reductase
MLQAIFALADDGTFGDSGGLPWDHPADRAHFRATTLGHAIVMGRRTWQEVGHPLEGRSSVVVSRTLSLPAGVEVARSLDDAVALALALDPDPFVIGGVALLAEAMPRLERVFLTRIPGRFAGDTRYEPDLSGHTLVSERAGPGGLRFLVLERTGNLAQSRGP